MAIKLRNNPTQRQPPQWLSSKEKYAWTDPSDHEGSMFIRQIAGSPRDWLSSDRVPFDFEAHSAWARKTSALLFGFSSGDLIEAVVHYSKNPDGASVDTGIVVCRRLFEIEGVEEILALADFHANEVADAIPYNVLGQSRAGNIPAEFVLNEANTDLRPVLVQPQVAPRLLDVA